MGLFLAGILAGVGNILANHIMSLGGEDGWRYKLNLNSNSVL